MKPFFIKANKAIAGVDPMTASVLGAVTLGVFAFFYIIARYIEAGEGE